MWNADLQRSYIKKAQKGTVWPSVISSEQDTSHWNQLKIDVDLKDSLNIYIAQILHFNDDKHIFINVSISLSLCESISMNISIFHPPPLSKPMH